MKTYIKYIKNPLVKEDAERHTNIKGTNTGAVGRTSILPEQLGHDTKAKHIETAKACVLEKGNMHPDPQTKAIP
eukprot:8545906-Heterocapsa_arctica.AAC.1